MEVVHDSPEILMFHEIVSDAELEQIKTEAKPYVRTLEF